MNPTINKHNEQIIGDKAVKKEEVAGNSNTGGRNIGGRNSGSWNTGDWNSGNWNTGDWNSGGWNTGNFNSGGRNTGDWNTGNWNSGNRNSGGRNSGSWNSGDRNSGGWNSGNGYINLFCTDTRYFLFNIECTKEEAQKTCDIDMSWFDLTNKTYKEAWSECPEEVLDKIKQLKNFDPDKFFEITGIKVLNR